MIVCGSFQRGRAVSGSAPLFDTITRALAGLPARQTATFTSVGYALLCGLIAAGGGLWPAVASASDVATPVRWLVERSRPAVLKYDASRGESLRFEPQFLDNGQPVDLTGVWSVFFNYKGVGSTNVHSIAGQVVDATNGQVFVAWSSANELTNSVYAWDITVNTASSSMNRAFGLLTLSPSVGYQAQTGTLQSIYVLDFGQIQLLNVGLAPFLSTYELNDVRSFIASVSDGSGSLHVRDLQVDGSISCSNWPPYLARTNDAITNIVNGGSAATPSISRVGQTVTIVFPEGGAGSFDSSSLEAFDNAVRSWWATNTYLHGTNDPSFTSYVARVVAGANTPGVVTNNQSAVSFGGVTAGVITLGGESRGTWPVAGAGGGVGSYTNTEINGIANTSTVSIADGDGIVWARGTDGIWRASGSIPASWSSTGTLYWVVNGVQIGRVDSNGITLLQGSLQLYEETLRCNVSLLDGTRTAPSLTPLGHPNTIGMYVRGYQGSYGFAFAHASTDVAIVHAGGIRLMNSNMVFSGNGSALTDVPEEIYRSWVTNPILPALTITNSGSINVIGYSGTNVFAVNGSNGAVSIRGQDSDARYQIAVANWWSGSRTTYTHNATGTVIVTNVYTYTNGHLLNWTQ